LAEQAQWYLQEVQPHERALRNYLARHFPSVEVDDVIQESYFKLFRARSAGPIVSAKAYLFAIARNTALTLFRRRRIYSETPLNELAERDGALEVESECDGPLADDRVELAVQIIDRLPRRCREIFQLAAFERQSPAAIAARLGLAESTVYVQLALGVRKCAAELKKWETSG
jgi:RNA polymerase sigma factor (sigma-70 family)